MNKCNKTKTSSQIQTDWCLPEESGGSEMCKGDQIYINGQIFGGEHTIEHIGTEL